MLKGEVMNTRKIENFLRTLGIRYDLLPTDVDVPYYLNKKFDFQVISFVEDKKYILIKAKKKGLLENILSQAQIVSDNMKMPFLLVFKNMTSEEKILSWKLKIPYISEENDIFLPELGLLMQVQKQQLESKKFTPSEQALMIDILLEGKLRGTLEEVALRLNVSRMTVYRALGKFLNESWITEDYHLMSSPTTLFNDLDEKGYFINPVKSIYYTRYDSFQDVQEISRIMSRKELLKSSYSALSDYTNLAEHQEQFAISKDLFKIIKSNKQIELFKNSFMGMIKLEVWEYLPRTCRNSSFVISRSVDPISLYLSLRHDDDPRVEIEVDHFKQKINDILGENDGW